MIIATISSSSVEESTPGTYTYHYRAQDSSGNARTRNVSVSVIDTNAPTITAPADAMISCGATPGDLGIPIVSDGCAPVASISTSNDAPANLLSGTTLVTWTAIDPSTNVETDTQNVTINDVPPTFAAPADVRLACNAPTGADGVQLGEPSVSDDCTATPTVSNDAPGSASYGLSETIVSWSANDGQNPPSTGIQSIMVVPSLGCDPGGTLYARGTGPQETYAVDQSDASTIALGMPTLAGGTTGFAADPATGAIWAIANDNNGLYTVDPVAGTTTLVGGEGPILTNAGFAFDSRAQMLYATDAGALYQIDPGSGARTFVGSGTPAPTGFAYDPGEDLLYGAFGASSDSLYTVDRNSGAVTLVGAFGVDADLVGLGLLASIARHGRRPGTRA